MTSLRNGEYRAWVRRFLAKRHNAKCCYCKRPFTKRGPTRLTIEHMKARMEGGSDQLVNLAAACFHCNQHRGQQMHSARQKKASV